MAYGYNPRSGMSPMEQLRRRVNPILAHINSPNEGVYPSFINNANPIGYGRWLRKAAIYRNIEESRRARAASHFGWHSRITDTILPSVLLARQRIESDRMLSASRAASQYAINTRFGIGRTRKSAKASAEILSQLFEEQASSGSSGAKKMSDTISKGIQTAFGGKELTGLARALGVSRGLMGAWGLVYALRKYLGTAMTAARQGAQIGWSAEFTGTTPIAMAGTSGAVSAFGGGVSSAARLYSLINAVKQGTLVGKPNPWAAAIKEYGLNLASGSLEGGGWKSEEGIIKEISNKMASLNPRAAADLAQSLGLDQSMFMLLRGGYDEYQRRVRYANEGSPFADEKYLRNLENLSEQTNILGDEFKKLAANLAPVETSLSIIESLKDALHWLNKDVESKRTDISKRKPIDIASEFAGYGIWDALPGTEAKRTDKQRKFFEKLLEIRSAEEIKSGIFSTPGYEGLNHPARDRFLENLKFYEKENLNRRKSWENFDIKDYGTPNWYNFPTGGSSTPQVNNSVTLNLGNIKLKSGGEDTIREAVVASIDWGFVPTAIARV